MATKAFKGEVIESKDSTFVRDGETIVGWSISLMIDEDTQKTFFVSERNLCYPQAKQIVKGNSLLVHADATRGQGDRVKWLPVEIKKLDETGSEIPF